MDASAPHQGVQSTVVCLAPLPAATPGLHAPGPAEPTRPRGWRRVAVFWSISGGTVLSVIGFIAMLLFEQYSDSLTELRNDLKHFNETCADLVKRDSLRNRLIPLRDSIKELQAAGLSGAREAQAASLANSARDARLAQLERELKAIEEDRKEMGRELQRLRERLASVEGRQAAAPFGGNPKFQAPNPKQ